MLIKDNPFGLKFISGGENNVTSKAKVNFQRKWGGQNLTIFFFHESELTPSPKPHSLHK
jgi:hypothetical protein